LPSATDGDTTGNKEGDLVLQAAEQASTGGLFTFLPIILIFAAMYFLMIRPQSKRRRAANELQARLAAGDEVQTVGGLYGTVTAVDDESVTIEASPGVSLRFAKGAIARVTNNQENQLDGDAGNADAAKTIEQG
jgi:preprotein translocase subunit YajC